MPKHIPGRTKANYHLSLPTALYERLQAIAERDGVPIAEQMRRAIQQWVNERDIETTRRGTR
jgi:predicted DNA-binding protein